MTVKCIFNRKSLDPLVFIAVGLLFVIFPVGAEGVTLSIHDLSAAAGSTVSVPVSVTNVEELSAATIEITYDPAVLKFKGTELGDTSKNGIIEASEIRPGAIEIDFEDPSGVSLDGDLVKTVFEVTGIAGTTSKIGINANALRNLDNNDVPVETTNGGNITVSGTERKSPVPLWCPVLAAVFVILITLKRRN
jgi:hypothetical protein